MSVHDFPFGYYPKPLDISVGSITITSLPDIAETVIAIENNNRVDGDWIYAPQQEVRSFGGNTTSRPYPSRIFTLPKTHLITHDSLDGENHIVFHLWALSFFTGMRLTSTEAGFVDSTPIKPGKLVDFVLLGKSMEDAIALAEAFWVKHRSNPERFRLFCGAVHALFLAQNPQNLQFERFLLFYTAFDACFALTQSLKDQRENITHTERVSWMCEQFGMQTPDWAIPVSNLGKKKTTEVASLRNASVHEALFMGEPLGFALHGVGAGKSMTLEMKALVCRLLVALLGGDQSKYVVSPVNTRQRHGLRFTVE